MFDLNKPNNKKRINLILKTSFEENVLNNIYINNVGNFYKEN